MTQILLTASERHAGFRWRRFAGGCFAAREAFVTRLCRMWVYFLVDWHLVSFRVLDEGEFGKAQMSTVLNIHRPFSFVISRAFDLAVLLG